MKKMKNSEILEAINKILAMKKREEERGEKLFADKIKLSFAVKKNLDTLIGKIKPYYELKNALVEECKSEEKDKDGNWIIRKDCESKWQKNISELLDIEIEVNVHGIKLSDLEGISLSMSDMDAIYFMIDETEF